MPELEKIPARCEFDLDKIILRFEVVVPSEVKVIDEVVPLIAELVQGTGCEKDVDRIELALHEALANAILHGNRADPTKGARVCVVVQDDCGALIVVKDVGSKFDPQSLPSPVKGENLLAPHGRGLFLINELMDDVQFRFKNGTEIWLRSRPKSS